MQKNQKLPCNKIIYSRLYMYIPRDITSEVKRLIVKFPIVTLTGPRQSGKSTLLRHEFPDYKYLSLESPDIREMALNDPQGFLKRYPSKVILDEIQRVPELLSYMQTHVDDINEAGMYLLSGSQNFLLMKGLSQSLAGRTALLTLLPLSRKELHDAGMLPADINVQIYSGFYPRIYDMDIDPRDFYQAYVQMYVERDVRDILHVSDLNKFVRFIRLCAGRTGQILNMTSMANETGVTSTTVDGWLSILEGSYICYRLEPNHNNFNKRIIKSPKLYFYDTGLACSLLGLSSPEQIDTFYMKGALFENLVINQFLKNALNRGERPDFTFWRDSQGNEIDLIATRGKEMSGYEIKSSSTFNYDYFKGLEKWGKLSGTPAGDLNVIYMGNEGMVTGRGNIISFHEFY